ncbi:MMPL family transporter [Mycolicibacterium poriferae]|uniref:MMPL family transporter n=1 Tax=Mycolicibacterium poriferae TaxID=39694 RepID=UPI003D2EF5F5
MFAWWGRMVYRYRFFVVVAMTAACLGAGVFGISLGEHVTQSGFFDDGSESAQASRLADTAYGRDTSGHIIAIYTAPEGTTVDDPAVRDHVNHSLDTAIQKHPDEILRAVGYFTNPEILSTMADASRQHAFMSIQLRGDDDDTILNNYKKVANSLGVDGGVEVQLAGLQPLANELTSTIGTDQKRMELLALPLVAIVLFFVFGGVVAATLPVLVGGLSIAGALGIMRLISEITPVHALAQPVVSLIGLGIAIDYGLFVVSRFREELAEGYDTPTAVRRTVTTAGRTVMFSAILIVASSAGVLLFPQGFLKALTYAIIASVMLAAVLSITVLPAILGILGRNVDALGVRTLLRIPFVRNTVWLNGTALWFADRTQRTKTRREVENGFWGRLVTRVMKRPLIYAIPIIVGMVLLILPLGQITLGGISEKYLPPTNSVRQAQEQFDKTFPGFRTEPLTLVITHNAGQPVTDEQVADIRNRAMAIPGFTVPDAGPASMWAERSRLDGATQQPDVRVIQNGLIDRNSAAGRIDALRNLPSPDGLTIRVGGTPALEQDSIQGLFDKLPLMLLVLITTTTLLMFLAFGSLVLPIKAAIMSVLTLGATMGVLTAMFVDGLFSSWLNFTPQPLSAPVLGLVIAIIYGLCTDYEVFLVSRMIEARAQGMSTAESIRIGTATTGRLITAAALILVVVAGAFVFSELVMLKYLAFGLLTALLLDATVIRMFLVPALMKWLGDECWWAPQWMKRIQQRIGLGEVHLPDEPRRPANRSVIPSHLSVRDNSGPHRPSVPPDRRPRHSAEHRQRTPDQKPPNGRSLNFHPDEAATTPLSVRP